MKMPMKTAEYEVVRPFEHVVIVDWFYHNIMHRPRKRIEYFQQEENNRSVKLTQCKMVDSKANNLKQRKTKKIN